MVQPSDDSNVGRIIAERYRVDGCIGSGGLGRVYRSWDLRLKRPVALKLLRSEEDEPSDSPSATRDRRLLKEARLAGRLSSPHVVRVFDSGRTERGEPFIILELLSGHDLSQTSRPEPGELLAPDEQRKVVGWILQALTGLASAHAEGIVHRDLKPSNLFLVDPEGPSPRIKLLDFGVSKQSWAATLPEESTLTQSGSYLGTPVYASPEQLRDARLADTRSDIWSVGVVLYELLCGARPFDRPSLPAVGAAIVGEQPAPLTGVSADLSATVLRCLEKDPARRFSSVSELARALAPFADDGEAWAERVADALTRNADPSPNLEPAPSGTETETWISESPPAPTRRASTRPFLATLALFALGAVGVAAWYHSQRAPEAVPPPPRPLEQATLQSQEQSTDTPQAEPAATAAAGSTELAQAPPPEAPSPALLPTLQRPPRHMVAPPPQPVSKASADQASASQPRSVLDER